jgi:hypothetical protein
MRLSIPSLLSLLGILLVPVAAEAAEPLRGTTIPGQQAALSLRADGYSVSVEGRGHQVTLTVRRGLSASSYVTRGTASPDGIRARFGHFGRIAVRFKPSGKASRRKPQRRCDGRPSTLRSGTFTGTFRFRGEDGYISIDAHRAKGRSATLPRWRCGNRGRPEAGISARPKRDDFEEAELEAVTPNERVVFLASGLHIKDGPSLIFFIAGTKERRGSVRISRFAFLISGKGRTFTFERTPRSASVRPPKPFHGSAEFSIVDGRPSWAGNLSVSLPGATVDLTGPAFKTKLVQPKSTKESLGLRQFRLVDPEALVQAAQWLRRPPVPFAQ